MAALRKRMDVTPCGGGRASHPEGEAGYIFLSF
jgi:hypothetical protein